MEGDIVSLQQPHSDVSTHFQLGEDEIKSPPNISPSQRQMKSVDPSDQWTDKDQRISMLMEERRRLIEERGALIKDLEECKSELFKRMPPTQISDDSIQKALGRIHGSIDSFVFDIMVDIVDNALYNYCRKQQQAQKPKTRKSRYRLDKFIRKADISAWGPYKGSNFYILSVIIQWILDTFVFDNPYPMGITEEHIRMLKEVEKGMTHASQAQKQKRIDPWKSETLTAMTALRENETRLEAASRRICHYLDRFLSPWLLEAGPFAKIEGRFKREILDPAIKLHQDLRSSSHQYDMRPISIFDRLSPKQMLDECDLKDAETWLKPRGEKEVGRALYCLHPSVVRLRPEGLPLIVIAKPVIVVTTPERERHLKPHRITGGSLTGSMAPSAAIDYESAETQIISSPDDEDSDNTRWAENASMSTDSDSTTTSGSRQIDFSQRRASHPITRRHEYSPGSPRRRLSVPQEEWDGRHDLPRDSRSYFEESRRGSGRPKEDQDYRPYRRGHRIEGTSNDFPSQAAARQSSRRASRDTAGDTSSPRRSANETSQPPISPSVPIPIVTSFKRYLGFPKQEVRNQPHQA